MAIFPLYKGLDAREIPDASRMNMGLWFERYFHGYADDFSQVDKYARTEWLRRLNTDALGDAKALGQKTKAIEQMAKVHHGQAKVYCCTAPFVTGMGNPHPLENGFTWHPTLGMPYLPGSSVKGLVRAAIETAYEGDDRPALLQRWFGTAKKDDVAEVSGCFIFLDALPTAPCKLVSEVMTPHMGKWYEKGGTRPLHKEVQPGDWHSPVPVGYLTARNLSLQFAVLPRAGNAQAAQELEQVWQVLDYALQWLGAGGKTAQGFGTLKLDYSIEQERQQQRDKEKKAQAEEAARANMSPIGLEIHQCLSERTDPNLGEIPALLNALKAGRWEGDTKLAIAQHLKALMEQAKKWKPETKAKKPEKDGEHQSTLLVMCWLKGQ